MTSPSLGGVIPSAARAPRAVTPRPIAIGISRRHACAASRQLHALERLIGSLTDPLTPSAAALLVEREAFAELGATSLAVLALGDLAGGAMHNPTNETADEAGRHTKTLTLVHAVGLSSHVAAAIGRLDATVSSPLVDVALTEAPVFLKSERNLRSYACDWCRAALSAGARAAAVVPVRANGALRGVVGVTWDRPRTFTADDRAFVTTLGVLCAQAIMRGYVTERDQAAREAAEHNNVAQAAFLRTMSHELRTPLAAMLNDTEVLHAGASGPITAAQRAQLERMRRSGEHLVSLIEELLRFARVDGGGEVVRVTRVVAARVVEGTLDIVQPIAERKGVRVRSVVPDEPIELATDALKLRQILVNLVTNAVKYTDVGEVLVSVTATGPGEEARVAFAVTDTGRGIAAADHERVFEAFWQADQSPLVGVGGYGLGLSVARSLARKLGGDVVVERSEPGHGSTFVAWLPARPRVSGSGSPWHRAPDASE